MLCRLLMIMKERMVRGMLVLNGKAKLYMNGSSNGFRKKNTMEVMRDRLIWQVCCYFRSDMEEDTANKYLLLGAGPD